VIHNIPNNWQIKSLDFSLLFPREGPGMSSKKEHV